MTHNNSPHASVAPFLHDKIIEILAQEKRGRVLDVPAGNGALAVALKQQGFDVSCGDIRPERFIPKEISCRKMDLNKRWPFEEGFFDYVVCLEGIEHLENPWHVIREAQRVLRPGGLLFMSTPNIISLKSRVSFLLYGYPNYFHYMIETDGQSSRETAVDHINPLPFYELRHILARVGFLLEEITTNRYLKRRSPFYRLLRFLVGLRGRSDATTPEKITVRQMILSDPLLFGELVIIKARKPHGA